MKKYWLLLSLIFAYSTCYAREEMLDTSWVQIWTDNLSSVYASPQYHYKVGKDSERTILAWQKFFYHENIDWAKMKAGQESISEIFINCQSRQYALKSIFAQTRDGKLLNYGFFPNDFLASHMRSAQVEIDKSFVDYSCKLHGW